jgi:MFS family permease
MLSLFNALLFGLSFVVLWKNRHLFKDTNRAPSKETTKSNFWQENLANLRLFRQFPQLTRFILVSLLANFLFSSFAGLINLTLLDTVALRWGNYATSVAILNTLLMLGMIIGSLATSDVFAKWSIKHLMMTVFIAMGILSLALALSPHRYLITPLVLVTGYLLAKLNPRITAYLMRLVPENSLAAVSSIMGTAVTISIPFGQLLFMGLATALNVSFTWYLIAGGSGICLILASLIPLDAQETNFS